MVLTNITVKDPTMHNMITELVKATKNNNWFR